MSRDILAKMAVQITAQNAKFDAAMKRSQSQMTAFQTAARGLNSTLRTLGVGFGITEIFRGVSFGIGVMADFEKEMSTVKAITGATGKEFKALEDDAKRLGGATKFTASEVAQLQVAYGRLGFNTREILAATGATLSLAAATGEDLAKSADVAGSTVRGFGLDARETQRVVDVMAASFNRSALGLDNFAEAVKYVAPVAASANVSLEETTAMLAVLADNGIRGSMAGTSLRKIISDVGKESGSLSERLKTLADRGLTGAEAMDEVGRTAYASLLILAKHIDKVNEGAEGYKKVTGEADKMGKVIDDNLKGDVTLLTSAIEGLILKFNDGIDPMRQFVQGLRDVVTFLAKDEVVQFLKGAGEQALFLNWLKLAKSLSHVNDEGERMEKWLKEMDEKAIIDAFGISKQLKASGWDGGVFGPLFEKFATGSTGTGTNAFGLFGSSGQNDNPIVKTVNNLESLRKKEKELLEQFNQIDAADKKKQKNIADEIKLTRDKIKAIEDLLEVQKPKELKMVFTPDLEAEASLNPELRNMQAINQAKELQKALDGVATSAAFAGGAVIQLEEATGNAGKSMANVMMDLGPLVAGTLTDFAAGLGAAAVGAENFGDVILKSLGGFMQAFGGALIATGVGKISFDFFSGPQMIAAGAVLVAAGAALQSTINNRPDLGSGSGGRHSYGGSAPGRTPSEVGVRISGRFRGYDMAITGDNERYRRGRIG